LQAYESVEQAGRRILSGEFDRPGVAEARTLEDGFFELQTPGVGHWTLRIDAEGYAPQQTRVTSLDGVWEIEVSPMKPSREIEVQVTDEQGAPIVGAPVVISRRENRVVPEGWFDVSQSGRTDTAGRVIFAGSPGAPYDTAAWSREHGLVRGTVTVGPSSALARLVARTVPPRRILVVDTEGDPVSEVLLYTRKEGWPLGGTNSRGQVQVRLASPEAAEVVLRGDGSLGAVTLLPESEGRDPLEVLTIDLVDEPGTIVRVIDAESGVPVEGALVWAIARERGETRFAQTDARGESEFVDPPPGDVLSLAAVASGYSLIFGSGSRASVAERREEIRLQRAASLGGFVKSEDGAPLVGVEVRLEVDRSRSQHSDAESGFRSMSWLGLPAARATTLTGGKFLLPPVPAGVPYSVTAATDGFAKGILAIEKPASGESRTDLQIVLGQGAALVATLVGEDGQPVPGAEAAVYPFDERRSSGFRMFRSSEELLVSALSDEEGGVSLAPLSTGEFELVVRAPGFAPTIRRGITVVPGTRLVELGLVELVEAVELRGVVVDTAGAGVPNATVLSLPSEAPPMMASVFCNGLVGSALDGGVLTSATGGFAITELAPGAMVSVLACDGEALPGFLAGVRLPTEEEIRIEMPPSVVISGRVSDEDGQGISGAVVSFSSTSSLRGRLASGRLRTLTDSDGRFRLKGVPIEAGMVTASATGFLIGRESVALEVGQAPSEVLFELFRGAALSGIVRSPDGEGIAGAYVGVREDTGAGGYRSRSVATDSGGRYLLEGLPIGVRSVEASHDEFFSVSQEVELRSGTNTLDLRFEPGARVAGRVVDDDDRPVSGATVHLSGLDDSREVPTDVDGRFEIKNARPGRGQIFARFGQASSSRDDLDVGSPEASDLLLRVGGRGAIIGQLFGLEPGEAVGVRIWASSESRSAQGVALGNRQYRIDSLPVGWWRVSASLNGNTKLATGEIEVVEGAGEAILDLDFESGVILSGTVIDRNGPVGQAQVTAFGQDVAGYFHAMTDRTGRFEMGNLKLGTYSVSAAARNGRVTEEVVVEGDLDLTLEVAGGVVTGRVTDADSGLAVAEARVTIDSADEEVRYRSQARTPVDSSGFFRAEGVSGAVRITAVAPGYGVEDERVEVPADGLEVVDFQLRVADRIELVARGLPAGTRSLDVIVTHPTGQPLVEQRVKLSPEGVGRLLGVSDGTWRLQVESDGMARVTRTVQVPTQGSIDLLFVPEASLRVEVPELKETETTGTIGLVGSDGQRFEAVSRFGRSWKIYRGSRTIHHLPSDVWQVSVVTIDGRRWTGSVATKPGADAVLTLSRE